MNARLISELTTAFSQSTVLITVSKKEEIFNIIISYIILFDGNFLLYLGSPYEEINDMATGGCNGSITFFTCQSPQSISPTNLAVKKPLSECSRNVYDHEVKAWNAVHPDSPSHRYYCENSKSPVMFMPKFNGKTLDHWYFNEDIGTVGQIQIFLGIVNQLAKLHAKDICHGDIGNPGNIIVNEEKRSFDVRLIDFGCSTKCTIDNVYEEIFQLCRLVSDKLILDDQSELAIAINEVALRENREPSLSALIDIARKSLLGIAQDKPKEDVSPMPLVKNAPGFR